MWITVIIAIIGYILYSFFSSREKMLDDVRVAGGLQEKYKILLTHLLSDSNAQITQINKDSITISWTGEFSNAQISIIQGFGKINIIWTSTTALAGPIKEKWEFFENLDQSVMAKKITQDIEFQINNIFNRTGVNNKIGSPLANHLNNKYITNYNNSQKDKSIKNNKLIVPKSGIDGIIINQTKSSEIIEKYGKKYQLINHNDYSFEMKYPNGISCFYKQNDPLKKIYFVLIRQEFGGFTKNGIDLNSFLTVADLANLYKEKKSYSTSEGSNYSFLEYGGLTFFVDKKDSDTKFAEETYINAIGIG